MNNTLVTDLFVQKTSSVKKSTLTCQREHPCVLSGCKLSSASIYMTARLSMTFGKYNLLAINWPSNQIKLLSAVARKEC